MKCWQNAVVSFSLAATLFAGFAGTTFGQASLRIGDAAKASTNDPAKGLPKASTTEARSRQKAIADIDAKIEKLRSDQRALKARNSLEAAEKAIDDPSEERSDPILEQNSERSFEKTRDLEKLERVLAELQFSSQHADERGAIAANANRNRFERRSAFEATHATESLSSPTRALQTVRNERTGIPMRGMDALPGPQDPNDLINHPAHGTSATVSYKFVPFRKTAMGSALLTRANPDILSSEADGSTALDYGVANAQRELAEADPATEAEEPTHQLDFGLQVRPGVVYNSGYQETGKVAYSPGYIILNHSPAAHGKGQLKFLNLADKTQGFLVPFRAPIGYSIMDTTTGTLTTNADFVSLDGNTVQVRTAAARLVSASEDFGLSFGKMETLFGDLGAAPSSALSGSLVVGAVANSDSLAQFTSTPQLRLHRYFHSAFVQGDVAEFSMSLEDPNSFQDKLWYVDKADKNNIEYLNRYPAIVSRIRYLDPNEFDSLQLAGLVLPTGFDSKNNANLFHEAHDTAMGISGAGRLEVGNHCLRDTIYFGAVGGKGIGSYVFGNLPSAVLASTKTAARDDLNLVNVFGSYAAYRRLISTYANGSTLSTNVMGGMALAGRSVDSTVDDQPNRKLYQIGINLLWTQEKNVVGLEYQYGSREVQGGLIPDVKGENHRLAFIFQYAFNNAVATSSSKNSVASRRSALHAATAQDFRDAAFDPRSSRKSKLRF